jgi:hypothetical protein
MKLQQCYRRMARPERHKDSMLRNFSGDSAMFFWAHDPRTFARSLQFRLTSVTPFPVSVFGPAYTFITAKTVTAVSITDVIDDSVIKLDIITKSATDEYRLSSMAARGVTRVTHCDGSYHYIPTRARARERDNR